MGELRLLGKAPRTTVTVPEAAQMLRRSQRTVRYWCERGWVVTTTTPGGHYRISLDEVERIRAGKPLVGDIPPTL